MFSNSAKYALRDYSSSYTLASAVTIRSSMTLNISFFLSITQLIFAYASSCLFLILNVFIRSFSCSSTSLCFSFSLRLSLNLSFVVFSYFQMINLSSMRSFYSCLDCVRSRLSWMTLFSKSKRTGSSTDYLWSNFCSLLLIERLSEVRDWILDQESAKSYKEL